MASMVRVYFTANVASHDEKPINWIEIPSDAEEMISALRAGRGFVGISPGLQVNAAHVVAIYYRRTE